MAYTLAVFGVLSVGDVHAVFVDDRCADDLIAGLRPYRVLRVGIELPELLAGLRLVTTNPAVALSTDDLDDAADRSDRWSGPLTVEDSILDRVVLPHQLASILVEGDDCWRLRRRNVDVAFVLPVRRAHEDQVAPDDRRRVRHVVRVRP